MKKFLKKWLWRVLILGVIAFAIWKWWFDKEVEEPESYTVERGEIVTSISVNAALVPERYAHISSESPTLATEVRVKVGDTVAKGETLVNLDRSTLWAQIREAQVGVERAVAEEQGARRKSARTSKEQRLALKKASEQARQRLNQLYALSAKNALMAPIDGVVTEVNIREGEIATGTLVRIIDPLSLHIESFISESDIVDLYVGQKAEMTFDAKSREQFPAMISQIYPEATNIQDVIYFRTLFIMLEDDPSIRPGMSGDIDIITTEKKDVLTIPLRYVRRGDDGTFVSVRSGIDDKGNPVYEKRMITLGIEGDDDGNAEIVDGLSLGEVIYLIRDEEE